MYLFFFVITSLFYIVSKMLARNLLCFVRKVYRIYIKHKQKLIIKTFADFYHRKWNFLYPGNIICNLKWQSILSEVSNLHEFYALPITFNVSVYWQYRLTANQYLPVKQTSKQVMRNKQKKVEIANKRTKQKP